MDWCLHSTSSSVPHPRTGSSPLSCMDKPRGPAGGPRHSRKVAPGHTVHGGGGGGGVSRRLLQSGISTRLRAWPVVSCHASSLPTPRWLWCTACSTGVVGAVALERHPLSWAKIIMNATRCSALIIPNTRKLTTPQLTTPQRSARRFALRRLAAIRGLKSLTWFQRLKHKPRAGQTHQRRLIGRSPGLPSSKQRPPGFRWQWIARLEGYRIGACVVVGERRAACRSHRVPRFNNLSCGTASTRRPMSSADRGRLMSQSSVF